MASAPHSFFSPEEIFSTSRGEVRQRVDFAASPYLRLPLFALGSAISYYLGTEIGYLFTPSNTPIGTLWPPNAILLAWLLLVPVRIWPALLLGVVPAHFIAQFGNGAPPSAAIGWLFGNVGEALLGAVCIRAFAKRKRVFESLRGLVAFLLFGVVLAPLVTSFLDAAVVVLTRQANNYWLPWTTRLSSNMVSELIFVPMIVLIGQRKLSSIRTFTIARWIEAALLVSGIVLAMWLVFGAQNPVSSIPALICLPLPFFLWAALRFDLSMLSSTLLVVALFSLKTAINGNGPLHRASIAENVLLLHFFYLAACIPLVLLKGFRLEQCRALASTTATRSRLIGWEERERYRVSRELHNGIVQRLALIAVEADRWVSGAHVPRDTDVQTLCEEVKQVSQAARDLSNEVHPFILEYAGLEASLRSLCRRMARDSRVDVRFAGTTAHGSERLGMDVSLCLYRVAEEALQNVEKHSRARTATVELKIEERNAVLRILDDGVGITSEGSFTPTGGLQHVREAVTVLGGHLDINFEHGTTITATLPI
ncbi:MAG TPA: MASE1 domain-containing protein [Terriglobales bacterium]|nr:MASE1 domain-containing protein [Terriglobales bacterium]